MSLYLPSSEAVAVAWLRSRTGGGVATTLPKDPATWPTYGGVPLFVQVTPVSGDPAPETPQRRSLVQFDVWAAKLLSNRPPWGAASAFAEALVRSFQSAGWQQSLRDALPAEFADARVQSVWAAADPRRIRDDPSGYARYTVDTRMAWVVLSGQDIASGLQLTT